MAPSSRVVRVFFVAQLLLAVTLPAQGGPSPGKKTEPQQVQERAEKAIREWLAAKPDQLQEEQLERTVSAVLDAGEPALTKVGGLWRAAVRERETGDPTSPKARKLDSLGTHLVIDFLERQSKSGMVFAGQYNPLRQLQPQAGQLLFKLLLETPTWFPDTYRSMLVPALRDVHPTPPAEGEIDAIIAIVEDQEYESLDLRRWLTYALYQWRRPEFVEPELAKWRRQSQQGDEEDRLLGLQELAQLHYNLRDYAASARVHQQFLSRSEQGGFRITPVDYYNAACNHNLSGDPESALAALEKCADLQASDEVDPSLKLERSLFEKDPEIALLRGTDRFRRLMKKAFGKNGDRDK